MPISALKHFYIACIRPILLYASPSWYSMLSQQQRMRILRVENLVLKVLDPCGLDYNDRTANIEIQQVLDLLNQTSQEYMCNIENNTEHCLNHLRSESRYSGFH